MKKMTLAALAALSAFATPPASAAIIEWSTSSGGNGHFYQFVPAPVASWTAARTAARASDHNGQQGYLATITSAAENAFISTMVSGSIGYLGGTDTGIEGTWTWDDGPEAGDIFWQNGPVPMVYENWNDNEPNNNLGTEDWLHFNFAVTGGWNDAQLVDLQNGYFVEFNATPGIPEPASWAMMLIGFGLVGGALRRQLHTANSPATA